MGQVPREKSSDRISPVYGLVGDGRLARHLSHYFDLLGIPLASWSRNSEAQAGIGAAQKLGECETILVALRDDVIESWILESGLKGKQWVHFSGALVTPFAAGMHPLMTFGSQLYSREEYERIPFICERGGPGFKAVFPELPNPHFEIPAAKKPLYHALCVMGGNFTTLLWQKVFMELRKNIGLPAEVALPYLETVAKNLARDPERAATGPLTRGDKITIRKNLESLEGDRYQKIYQAFVEANTQ